MSCSRLKFSAAPTLRLLRFRAVAKSPLRTSYTTACRAQANAGFRWKLLGASITIAAASTGFAATVAYCRETAAESEKAAAVRRLLEYYGLEKDELQERTIHAFQCVVEKFVGKIEAKKLEEKKRIAEDILKYVVGVSSDSLKGEIIEKLCTYWNDKEKGNVPVEDRLINDAIYGSVELSPLLHLIINTPEFHRLKDVRQLGAGHYVYPGANHTRFDHSIGVCHLSGVFARSLKEKLEKDAETIPIHKTQERKQYRFEDEEVLCVKIAGLCHDLGHGPLSHMFEHKVVPHLNLENVKEQHHHEDISVSVFHKMLKDNPEVLAEFIDNGLTRKHVQLIEEMINPPRDPNSLRIAPDRPFLYEIVANKITGIDVDKWDYYARDCHYLGIEQDFQWQRCMLLARIVKTPTGSKYKGEGKLRVAFREKELDNIYGMFKTRAVLHQKAYQHKTVKAVEKMIADALLQVKDMFLIRIKREGKSIKEAVELACHEDPEKVNLEWYLALTDSIVGTIQCTDGGSTDQAKHLEEAQKILTRIKRRDLYNCVFKIPVSRSANRCYTHGLPSDTIVCQECHKDDDQLKVVKKLSENDQLLKSFTEDICKDLPQIQPEQDIWVEIVKIKLPSEEDKDPVQQVVFYKKPTASDELPKAVLKKELKKTSRLVLPQTFVEYELRVYDKREKDKRRQHQGDHDRLKDATEAALESWKSKV